MKFLWRLLPVGLWMSLAWERRARKNALHYVADFRTEWDVQEFFETGRHDVEKFLTEAEWTDLGDKTLLEIGCGVGRMTRHLAAHFKHVDGVDISRTMIRLAKRFNRDTRNATFVASNGKDLRKLPDGKYDYVLSYIVFQHLPTPEVTYGYIREALRVLKPGGRFRFQARNDAAKLPINTYYGAPIEVQKVRSIAEEMGRSVLHVSGEGTAYCFFEIG